MVKPIKLYVSLYLRLWEQQNVDEHLVDLEAMHFSVQMINKSTELHSIKPAGHSPLAEFEKLKIAGVWGLGALLCTGDRLRKRV